jgi:hypothetical protein
LSYSFFGSFHQKILFLVELSGVINNEEFRSRFYDRNAPTHYGSEHTAGPRGLRASLQTARL